MFHRVQRERRVSRRRRVRVFIRRRESRRDDDAQRVPVGGRRRRQRLGDELRRRISRSRRRRQVRRAHAVHLPARDHRRARLRELLGGVDGARHVPHLHEAVRRHRRRQILPPHARRLRRHPRHVSPVPTLYGAPHSTQRRSLQFTNHLQRLRVHDDARVGGAEHRRRRPARAQPRHPSHATRRSRHPHVPLHIDRIEIIHISHAHAHHVRPIRGGEDERRAPVSPSRARARRRQRRRRRHSRQTPARALQHAHVRR